MKHPVWFEEGKFELSYVFHILFPIHDHQLAIFREQITLFEFLPKGVSHEHQDSAFPVV